MRSPMRRGLAAAAALFLGLAAAQAAAREPAGEPVGEVTLVLGKAYLHSPDGDRTRIGEGAGVRAGDRIETGSNGHVHVRFVDRALVSVRPYSRLEIERYEFDRRRPERSAVKFNLREGAARAISGEAVRAARSRFRLNTPVAAIGVRGTDFAVAAGPASTRALVNEGAIILAPLSAACSAEALGPCQAGALELTGDSLQLVEVGEGSPFPRLLPPEGIRNPDLMREEVQALLADGSAPASSDPDAELAAQDEGLLEGGATLGVAGAQTAVGTVGETLLEGVAAPGVTGAAQEAASALGDAPPGGGAVLDVAVGAAQEAASALGDAPALLQEELADRELAWGHYAAAADTDRIALPAAEARIGRAIAVGNFEYGLFRREDAPRLFTTGSGVVGFALDSAQAVFSPETGVASLMRVDGGSLGIDFANSRFSTTLRLDHELTGAVDFSAAGRVVDGGFLRASGGGQRLFGAVSLDHSEAGYFFERALEAGGVSGLTLWSSR